MADEAPVEDVPVEEEVVEEEVEMSVLDALKEVRATYYFMFLEI